MRAAGRPVRPRGPTSRLPTPRMPLRPTPRRSPGRLAAAAAATLLSAGAARADVIYQLDFEGAGTTATYTYGSGGGSFQSPGDTNFAPAAGAAAGFFGYGYQDTNYTEGDYDPNGDADVAPITAYKEISATDGVGGGGALAYRIDSSNLFAAAEEDIDEHRGGTAGVDEAQYAYYGAGGFGFGGGAIDTAPLDGASASDVRLSFDIAALGQFDGSSPLSGDIEIELQQYDADGLVGQRGYRFFFDAVAQGSGASSPFETVSFTLDQGTLTKDSLGLDADFNNVNFNFFATGTATNANFNGVFGYDANNALVLDNITLSTVAAVPEPGSALLLLVGAAGAAGLRRRKSAA